MLKLSLLRSASAGAATVALVSTAALAQQNLPTIDIGVARGRAPGAVRGTPQGAARTTGDAAVPANAASTRRTGVAETDPTAYRAETASTALKMRTPVMETPVSVQVVPQQVILDQQATTVGRAVENVSGVRAFDPTYVGGNDRFQIRGFDTNFVYIDGLRIQDGLPGTSTMINVDRVEVLKGPAAILYGRADPGGIVNIVTKKPLATRYTSLSQTFGSYGFYRTTVDTTGPLTKDDTLLYRVTAEYDNDHTFKETNHYRNYFISPVVQWNMSKDTQLSVNLQYSHQAIPFDAGHIAYTKYNPLSAFFGVGPVAFLPRGRTFNEADSSSRIDSLKYGYNFTHKFNEDWTLTNRLQGIKYQDHTFLVVPVGFGPGTSLSRLAIANNDSRHSITTNLDLQGKFDTFGISHTVLVGGDYLVDRPFNSFFGFSNYPQASIDYIAPIHTFTPTYNWLYTNLNPGKTAMFNRQQWFGFYVQDQIKLPYNFFLLAGARYDRALTYTNLYDGNPETTTNNAQRVTPRFGLLWRPIPEASIYGSYMENFGASGGLTGFGPSARPLPSESARQWEVGVKTELLDGRFMATFAYYDLTKTNISVASPDPALAAIGSRSAIGEVRNRGFETDITGEILPGWKVIGSYSYIDSQVAKDTGNIVDPLGNLLSVNGFQGFTPPDVSRHTGSLFTTYEFLDGELRGLKFGGGLNARSKSYGDALNSFHLPGYAIVNLFGAYSWNYQGYKLTAQLNVENLADTRYYTSAFRGPLGVSVGAPRIFRGQLRMEF